MWKFIVLLMAVAGVVASVSSSRSQASDVKSKVDASTERRMEPRGASGGRPGGPGRPGILPPHIREQLNLTDEQNRQLQELQDEVGKRMHGILTDEQKLKLQTLRSSGPDGTGNGMR